MRKWNKQRVSIEIAVTTRNRLIVYTRMNIFIHPDIQTLDVGNLKNKKEEERK